MSCAMVLWINVIIDESFCRHEQHARWQWYYYTWLGKILSLRSGVYGVFPPMTLFERARHCHLSRPRQGEGAVRASLTSECDPLRVTKWTIKLEACSHRGPHCPHLWKSCSSCDSKSACYGNRSGRSSGKMNAFLPKIIASLKLPFLSLCTHDTHLNRSSDDGTAPAWTKHLQFRQGTFWKFRHQQLWGSENGGSARYFVWNV